MNQKSERRVFERQGNDAPLIYAYHNSDKFFHAIMCNFSKDGMCFETPDAIDPGSDLYIMMENYSPDTIQAEHYEGYFAEVRWCCPLPDPQASGYRVGVKYYRTVVD